MNRDKGWANMDFGKEAALVWAKKSKKMWEEKNQIEYTLRIEDNWVVVEPRPVITIRKMRNSAFSPGISGIPHQ